jgi:hypothetical protein
MICICLTNLLTGCAENVKASDNDYELTENALQDRNNNIIEDERC